MVLDINLIRKEKGGDPEKVREWQRRRFADVELVDKVIALDEKWRTARYNADGVKAKINATSKEIGQLMKAKKKDEAQEKMATVKDLKVEHAKLSEEASALEKEVQRLYSTIGNEVHDSVPFSNNEEEGNAVVHQWGEKTDPAPGYHHHELLHMIGGYESARGAKVAGHRGYFLTGPGVMLNQALISYGREFLRERGYTEVQPPYFMNKSAMAKTAQLEQFDEELYHVPMPDEDKYLIATSEQPISALYMDEWMEPGDLPIKMAGISTCFRKEAGSSGKDTWGVFRVHQFEKVEQFIICDPEKSWELHDEMIEVAMEFYKSLNLPFHVVNIVSGKLNNAAAKKLDLEAWFPSSYKAYRELVSCSNCTDYQARSLEIRYGSKKQGQRSKAYCHMLNATLCATERTMCCLLENYQTPEGVKVPEVLQKYCGGKTIFEFVKERPINYAKKKTEGKKGKRGKNKDKAKDAAAAAPADKAEASTKGEEKKDVPALG